MAEPLPRADRRPLGRTRSARQPRRARRALLLTGAILALVLGGLFLARPALAAPAAPAAQAATAAVSAPVKPAAPATAAAAAGLIFIAGNASGRAPRRKARY